MTGQTGSGPHPRDHAVGLDQQVRPQAIQHRGDRDVDRIGRAFHRDRVRLNRSGDLVRACVRGRSLAQRSSGLPAEFRLPGRLETFLVPGEPLVRGKQRLGQLAAFESSGQAPEPVVALDQVRIAFEQVGPHLGRLRPSPKFIQRDGVVLPRVGRQLRVVLQKRLEQRYDIGGATLTVAQGSQGVPNRTGRRVATPQGLEYVGRIVELPDDPKQVAQSHAGIRCRRISHRRFPTTGDRGFELAHRLVEVGDAQPDASRFSRSVHHVREQSDRLTAPALSSPQLGPSQRGPLIVGRRRRPGINDRFGPGKLTGPKPLGHLVAVAPDRGFAAPRNLFPRRCGHGRQRTFPSRPHCFSAAARRSRQPVAQAHARATHQRHCHPEFRFVRHLRRQSLIVRGRALSRVGCPMALAVGDANSGLNSCSPPQEVGHPWDGDPHRVS